MLNAVASFALLVGLLMQVGAYSSFGPVVGAMVLYSIGAGLAGAGGSKAEEFRNYFLTISTCTFVAGVAFLYEDAHYFRPIHFIDSLKFLQAIDGYGGMGLNEMMVLINAPLAIRVWHDIRSFLSGVGVDVGSWVFVQTNTVLVGLAAVCTTRAAREIVGNDTRKLIRLGIMLAFSGAAFLFGALLLRDSFALLINAFWFWHAIKAVKRPSVVNLIISATTTVFCAWAMFYIREKATYFIFFGGILAVGAWYLSSGFSPVKVVGAILSLGVSVIVFDMVSDRAVEALEVAEAKSESYSDLSKHRIGSGESLGYSLVVSQPLPIRLVAGTVYMFVHPIPLWRFLEVGRQEMYLLLKGYHGLYMVWLTPALAFGGLLAVRSVRIRSTNRAPLIFLLAYCAASVASVAVTSLEVRHFGQFLPVLLLLALLSRTDGAANREAFDRVRILWYGLVASIHLVWFILKI